MSRSSLITLVAALALAVPAAPSLARDDHKHEKAHDHGKRGHDDAVHDAKHGGQFVATTDDHGVEMVLTGTSLVFHMTEDDDPLEVTGSSFKAIIQTDAGTRMVELQAEGTTLKATLDAPLPKGTKIALTGKDPHGEIIQARFVTE